MMKSLKRQIHILLFASWIFGFVVSVDAALGDINTIAGNGLQGFSGDGGPATDASLNFSGNIFVDGLGNIYITDTRNDRIRKVDKSGIITTGAGGSVLDGGPATDASLNFPRNVFLHGSGNLYIADTVNNRIRKVDGNGIITTVAGNGNRGFSGDGGPATNAELDSPYSVLVDSLGSIYISDRSNDRIRKVDGNGIITTVAGGGNVGFLGDGGLATDASLNWPTGLFVDGSGSIYISDRFNNRIRKVDGNGIITTVAGDGNAGFSGDGGPATDASLHSPEGVFVDGSGNIYIADGTSLIRKVDGNGIITTVAGGGISNSRSALLMIAYMEPFEDRVNGAT